jgi:hypothetical protein
MVLCELRSLTDYGYIDFSPDKGGTWYRADTSINNGYCSFGAVQELPTFTGNSNGWKHFYYCLQVPFPVANGDTILYRFTFISDSIQTNKDGLMFDNLHFEDWTEGIQEVQNNRLISISPNPTSDELIIHRTKVSNNSRIQILNYTGQVLYDNSDFIGEPINTRQLTIDKRNLFVKVHGHKKFLHQKIYRATLNDTHLIESKTAHNGKALPQAWTRCCFDNSVQFATC